VLDFDHHCPVFGTCIGGRNMTAFRSFLAASSCLFYSVAATVLVVVAKNMVGDGSSHEIYVFAVVVTVLEILFVVSILYYFLTRYFGLQQSASCCSSGTSAHTHRQTSASGVRRRKVRLWGLEVPHVTVPVTLLSSRREYQGMGSGDVDIGGAEEGRAAAAAATSAAADLR
jgi:hypothetical protein